MHGISNRDTHLLPPPTTPQFIWQQQQKCGALGGSPMECGVGGKHYETRYFKYFIHGIVIQLYGVVRPWTVWIQPVPASDVSAPSWTNGVWSPSAACECGAEEQIVDHVVLQCPIHRTLHGLTVLDDETIEWLLNTCPEIWCGQAVDCNNSLKRLSTV